MITFDKVSKRYGDIIALSEVSFIIEPGEFVFLTGPSGAGKSTIIKLISREIVASSGTIKIGDVDIGRLKENKVPVLRRRLGIVFQDFKLLPNRTVFENIALSLEIQGLPKKDIDQNVKDILELTHLTDRAHLFPVQLAGGEMQRAVIARAIVGRPDVLLADEPTGNLDPTTSASIIKLLKEINKNQTTILMATHNASIVDEMSQRVLFIKKGKLIKDEKNGKYPHHKD